MGWEQLAAIWRQAAAEVAADVESGPRGDRPLVNSCPVCGHLLNRRDGIADCPLGHYTHHDG